jgi:hypothetical protein
MIQSMPLAVRMMPLALHSLLAGVVEEVLLVLMQCIAGLSRGARAGLAAALLAGLGSERITWAQAGKSPLERALVMRAAALVGISEVVVLSTAFDTTIVHHMA